LAGILTAPDVIIFSKATKVNKIVSRDQEGAEKGRWQKGKAPVKTGME
jgi:hypothetical protein